MLLLRDKLPLQGEKIRTFSSPELPIINQHPRLNMKGHIRMMKIVLILFHNLNNNSLKDLLVVVLIIMMQ
jgi:hypothetical protein